jgi:hypothetical protein
VHARGQLPVRDDVRQEDRHQPKARLTYIETELAIASADGSGLRKLTKAPAVELQPSWDPSGQRLAYMHFPMNFL